MLMMTAASGTNEVSWQTDSLFTNHWQNLHARDCLGTVVFIKFCEWPRGEISEG